MISVRQQTLMKDESKNKLKILMAEFAMYLENDTGAENDEHEKWIGKFIDFVQEERKDVTRQLVDKIDNIVAEFSDNPGDCLSIIGETLMLLDATPE